MKIGVLTSSRADYGIYLPLLNSLKNDDFFKLEVIAFGTHLSKLHGFTLNQIEEDSYKTIHTITTVIANDDEASITTSFGLTILKFAEFWKQNIYDLVLCLGDRYEMSAAVQAGIPFSVNFAHFHGGETTLGAIDNIYRHQITMASKIHFTASELYQKKVIKLIESKDYVYNVGSLSLSGIKNFKPVKKDVFFKTFNIPNAPYALVTFHPETIVIDNLQHHAIQIKDTLTELSKTINLVITMPNADTYGSIFRDTLINLNQNNIVLIENFGKNYYFSAMYYSDILIGNTSSGIIEAASFGKYVINVGNRQKGRMQSDNIINVDFESKNIVNQTNKILNSNRKYLGANSYYKDNATQHIISILKSNYEHL